MESYSAIKRDEVQIHAIMGASVQNLMLSGRSQAQKATYPMIPFVRNIYNRYVQREHRLVGARTPGERDVGGEAV